jgi:hypothetical protein
MFNSVAHTDTIFNDNLETKPRRKGGRPRKQPLTQLINGFPAHIAETAYFNVPALFVDVVAAIDNLAELKVVLYILRHTWGFREYNSPKRITIDEFMHGRKKADRTRMDSGTGLSERAVMQGLQRAIAHGFVVCYVDDSDQARVKHYYQLRMQSEEQEGPESPEVAGTFDNSPQFSNDDTSTNIVGTPTFNEQYTEESYTEQLENDYPEQETEEYDPYAGTIFSKNYQTPEQKNFVSETSITISADLNNNQSRPECYSARSENRTCEPTLRTKEIRNVHPSLNLEEAIRYLPTPDQLPKPKAKSPAFIRNIMTDFSRDLGDQDHIFSNIAQATRLYRNCGLTEEAFMQALYDARALAKKATQIRHLNSFGNPNRMPYFFRCLNAALKQEAAV